jgi:3-oxoacyl-[acyl-carrier-protein] synthase-1
MKPVSILKAGMVTPVGLSAEASCAAMRTSLDAFKETRFEVGGEPLTGAQVPLSGKWIGREKMIQMVVPAILECLNGVKHEAIKNIPLLLCLPEADRKGRLPQLDPTMLSTLEQRLQCQFAPTSTVFTEGRMGGVKAMEQARLLLQGSTAMCIVAGVDTLFVGRTIEAYFETGRLKTSANPNGFIPGEAAAAILVGQPTPSTRTELCCTGIGYGTEHATILSEEPLRADGLSGAITNAFRDASATWADIDYRITDANGEQYWFKEAALALTRTMRVRKETMDLWHPADCIGEIGAAIVPCVLGVAYYAHHKQYRPGPGVLCHFSSDGTERGAMMLNKAT